MVAFFYHLDYNDHLPDKSELSLIQLHARMFSIADQYEIPSLGGLALRKYSYGQAVSQNPVELLESIHDVYETTPSCIGQLREIACMAIRRHLPRILDDKDVAGIYEIVLTANLEFVKDLLRSYVSNRFYGTCEPCNSS